MTTQQSPALVTARVSYTVAIETHYLGPTNYRGSRVVAVSGNGHRLFLNWLSRLNSEYNHARAAQALCQKMNWSGELVGGASQHGYSWVFVA